ncbi:MAG: hypothetical protein JST04_02960 [Bdellovibrionales bacterium]|nr:hypothetical protein [Bdellovibrionales bacterium]
MSESGSPRPLLAAVLLALVLTAWCLASNSVETTVNTTEAVAATNQ